MGHKPTFGDEGSVRVCSVNIVASKQPWWSTCNEVAKIVRDLFHSPRGVKKAFGKRRCAREMQFRNTADLWRILGKMFLDPPLDISACPFVNFDRQRRMTSPASPNCSLREVVVEDQTT